MTEVAAPSVGKTMILIHHAITRGLDVILQRGTVYARDGYTDAATRAGFGVYGRALVPVLRGHHMSEDEVAFPALRAKLPVVPFDRLVADHKVMEGILEDLEESIADLATETQAGPGLRDVTRGVAALADLWRPHIEIEEQQIYKPEIIAAVVDASEGAQLGQALGAYAQEHVGPLSLAIPFLLYNLAQQEREFYAAGLPPAVMEQLVPVAWKEQWAPMHPFLLD